MFKYILEGAGDINWMAIFALVTFFLLFTISAWAIFGKSKAYINKMAHLPLEDNPPVQPEIQNKYEK